MPDQERRQAILTALAASAAPYLVGSAGARAKSAPRSVGIALVGLGYYSTELLGPALRETRHCRLAGVVTGTPAKAERWRATYDVPTANIYNYENFDEIAANKDIDIVYIVLPNSMHAEYTIRALKAGKHVICEKPMAVNAVECRAMIAAAEAAGRKLSVGYRMQFEPTTQELTRIGRDRDFGAVRMISAAAGYRESRPDTWKLRRAMGGGAMRDMGVYAVQAARYATGEEPVSVSAQTFTSRPALFNEVDETTSFQLAFPGGAVANLQTSHRLWLNTLDVRYERGWARLEPFQAYRGVKGATSRGALRYPAINQQAAQMDADARAVVDDRPVRVPGEEGLRDMIVVDAVYASIAAGGKTIRLTGDGG